MTPLDFIIALNETRSEAGVMYVALAVGFENTTIFVTPSEENPLLSLEQAIENGGAPVGLVGFNRPQGSSGSIFIRSFVGNEDWVKEYLTALAYSFGAQLESAGVGRMADAN